MSVPGATGRRSAAVRLTGIGLLAAGVTVALYGAGRALMEERLLARSPACGAYRRRVRWRLVPGLW